MLQYGDVFEPSQRDFLVHPTRTAQLARTSHTGPAPSYTLLSDAVLSGESPFLFPDLPISTRPTQMPLWDVRGSTSSSARQLETFFAETASRSYDPLLHLPIPQLRQASLFSAESSFVVQEVGLIGSQQSSLLQEMTLILQYKEGMNLRDFDRKTRALQDLAQRGKLVKTSVIRDQVVTREYRRNILEAAERQWGQINPLRVRKIEDILETLHADHLHELQLGGVDHPTALWMLDRIVNTSIGAQIQGQIRNVPIGTRINKVIIKDG